MPADVPVYVLDEPGALRAIGDLPSWALLSIRDDGLPPLDLGDPAGLPDWNKDRPRLDLAFDDYPTHDPFGRWFPPQSSHAAKIVGFGLGLRDAPPKGLVVHCAAGLSRSPAAVLGVLCAWGSTPEQACDEAIAAVRRGHDAGYRDEPTGIRPNPRLVALLDAALGLHGGLLRAVHDRWTYPHDWQFYAVDATDAR